jgi:hypothetical protein
MLNEREAEKLVILAVLPYLFGVAWLSAVARFTLELGDLPPCPTTPR